MAGTRCAMPIIAFDDKKDGHRNGARGERSRIWSSSRPERSRAPRIGPIRIEAQQLQKQKRDERE